MRLNKIILLVASLVFIMGFAACSNRTLDYREGSIHPAVARPARTREIRRTSHEVPRSIPQQTWSQPAITRTTPKPYIPPHVPTPTAAPTAIPIATPTPRLQETSNKLPVVIAVPPEARPSLFGKVLGAHTTKFNAEEANRVTNITKASDSINGHVVQSGSSFSYNQTVGPTIERRGYKKGIIFVDGEKKEGFGGGVCQVSTTLAIAAENAGMTITERHDHSRPVTYAEEGDEAATSYGGIDFKFKNEKPFPVVINSTVQGGMISVDIREAG